MNAKISRDRLFKQIPRAASEGRRLLAFCGALWLTLEGFNTTPLLAGSAEATLLLSLAWIIVPILLVERRQFLQRGVTSFWKDAKSSGFAVFVVVALASAALSRNPTRSLAYAFTTLLAITIWIELIGHLGPHFLTMLRTYAIMGAFVLLPIYLWGPVGSVALSTSRLMVSGDDHPNHLGELCLAILGASLAWRRWLVRLPIIALMFAIIVKADSRSALVAALITLGIVIALEIWTNSNLRHRRIALALMALSGFTLLVAFSGGVKAYTSEILALDNKYRGLDSGLAGRFDVWEAGWTIFLEHPVVGVGYRLHDEYLPDRFAIGGSVHNGYLATFLEVGILGAVPFFLFMALRVRALWRLAKLGAPLHVVGFGFVVGFMALVSVQPMMLNLANPLSSIAWCFLLGGCSVRVNQNEGLSNRSKLATSPGKAALRSR